MALSLPGWIARRMPGGVGGEMVRGSLAGAGLRVVEIGLSFVAMVALARVLGIGGLGVYSVAVATMSLLAVPATLGLNHLVTRELTYAHTHADWGRMRGLLLFANLTIVGMSILLGGALVLVLASGVVGISDEQRLTLLAALPFLPLVSLGAVRAATLMALRRVVIGQMPEFLIRPLSLLILIVGAIAMPGVELTPSLAMMLNSTAALLGFVVGTVLLWRALPRQVGKARPTFNVGPWMRSAFPMCMTDALRTASPNLAILLLGALGTSTAVGSLRIAQRGAEITAFAHGTMTMVASPNIARLYAEGQRERLQTLITRVAQVSLAMAGALLVVFAVGGEQLLELIFGGDAGRAYAPLLILCGAQVIAAFFGLGLMLLNLTGRERWTTLAFACGVVLLPISAFILIPPLQETGAALAMLLSLLVWNGVAWYGARRKLGLNTTAFH